MDGWLEPDDPIELPEGCISEDVVEEIRELLKHVEYSDPFPRPGNRSDAAMILIDQHINPPRVGAVEDPNVTWAKLLMKGVV